ncbi:MAG TPA: hypothetical protein VHK88_00345, partial [Aquihabitans sp.]|nr:hypothetical protein [Aquihabitans sp.]
MGGHRAVRGPGRLGLAVAAIGLAVVAAAAPTGASEEQAGDHPVVGRVVVVSVPGLGWEDLTPSATPALHEVADRGAVAALSIRTIGRETHAAESYA